MWEEGREEKKRKKGGGKKKGLAVEQSRQISLLVHGKGNGRRWIRNEKKRRKKGKNRGGQSLLSVASSYGTLEGLLRLCWKGKKVMKGGGRRRKKEKAGKPGQQFVICSLYKFKKEHGESSRGTRGKKKKKETPCGVKHSLSTACLKTGKKGGRSLPEGERKRRKGGGEKKKKRKEKFERVLPPCAPSSPPYKKIKRTGKPLKRGKKIGKGKEKEGRD